MNALQARLIFLTSEAERISEEIEASPPENLGKLMRIESKRQRELDDVEIFSEFDRRCGS